MEKIIDEKINEWRDCLARHSKGEATDRSILIRAVLSDMDELKSSLPKPIEVPQEFKDWYSQIKRGILKNQQEGVRCIYFVARGSGLVLMT
ncbi:hypothetical protein GQR36_24880 [Enterococcus termitis]